MYGLIASVAAVVPPAVYFADRKAKVDKLTKNSWFEWTWFAIWTLHIFVYAFPGMFWTVSFAPYAGFNMWLVFWQYYGTYISGGILTALVLSLYAASYFNYEIEAGLTQETILEEAMLYAAVMVPSFFVLLMLNKDFQYFY